MRSARIVLLCLWLVGCAVATADGPDGPSWKSLMSELEEDCEHLEQWLLKQPDGDLQRVADTAERAAAKVRLGYGVHEDHAVDGFATMARNCESWLLQVALEARGGHADLAADVFRGGLKAHCNDCHAAHERAHERDGR